MGFFDIFAPKSIRAWPPSYHSYKYRSTTDPPPPLPSKKEEKEEREQALILKKLQLILSRLDDQLVKQINSELTKHRHRQSHEFDILKKKIEQIDANVHVLMDFKHVEITDQLKWITDLIQKLEAGLQLIDENVDNINQAIQSDSEKTTIDVQSEAYMKLLAEQNAAEIDQKSNELLTELAVETMTDIKDNNKTVMHSDEDIRDFVLGLISDEDAKLRFLSRIAETEETDIMEMKAEQVAR
jgi:hypothetical protein